MKQASIDVAFITRRGMARRPASPTPRDGITVFGVGLLVHYVKFFQEVTQ
jgi:hypothetical protein